MDLLKRTVSRINVFLATNTAFYVFLGVFIVSAMWIGATSLYPMAFDEEFHYGLLKIYAGSPVPYGIEHTSDMAQYGAATADASYLYHYLMSFPYRLLDVLNIPNDAIIIVLRFINIAFVATSLIVFRRAFIDAGISRRVVLVGLTLVGSIPVFVHLAAHINYDNLLLLVIAWCVLLLVRLTNRVQNGKTLRLTDSLHLVAAVLIGMSVKYSFLPLALGMFVWIQWLHIVAYRRHKQTISSQVSTYKTEWRKLTARKRYVLAGLLTASVFFASHYAVSMITYGSPIPSCERVFSETECEAYGPWSRNKMLEASKSKTFQPLTFPEYMTQEWFPGMTQRLTFAVAGKTNDFETRLPLPALVYTYVTLTIFGAVCLVVQLVRRRTDWFVGFTALLTLSYIGVLAFQLYGDYIDTAEPVAINGRYLLPLLPLVAVILIGAMRSTLAAVDARIISLLAIVALVAIAVCGAWAGTYIVQADSDWFWPGFGQSANAMLDRVFERSILPPRY